MPNICCKIWKTIAIINLIFRSKTNKKNLSSPTIKTDHRKDSRLPEQLQRAMAAEAEAAREARAKIVRANGEYIDLILINKCLNII